MRFTSKRCSFAAALLALLAVAYMPAHPVHAQAAAPAPDVGALPEVCVNTGTDLQTLCGDTIVAAQTAFGVPAGTTSQTLNITDQQVQDYIATAPLPSEPCCQAACEFNANYCNCERSVLDFATQLTGGSINTFRSIVTAFQRVCNYKLMFEETCPAPGLRPTLPKQDCAIAVPTAVAPGAATSTAPGAEVVPADPAAAAEVPAVNATPTATVGK